jgi:hypothetical protein
VNPTPSVAVELELPADDNLVRLARLVVSGVASTVGMPLDDVENCRAAVDELCSTLIEVGRLDETLHIRISTEDGCLVGTGELARDPHRQPDAVRRDLSQLILSSVVDDHDVNVEPPIARFRFMKRSEVLEAT